MELLNEIVSGSRAPARIPFAELLRGMPFQFDVADHLLENVFSCGYLPNTVFHLELLDV